MIREMREANMESLAISPPEESKQFLDGKLLRVGSFSNSISDYIKNFFMRNKKNFFSSFFLSISQP